MTLDPAELERRIVFEDATVVVVDKPPDLPSTGRTLDDPDSLQHALIRRHGAMTWAVHQLDADTSGLNVFVREKRAVRVWQARMRLGTKTYLAVVHGEVAGAARLVDLPIGTLPAPRRGLGVSAGGRAARTHLRVLDRAAGFSLLEVRLETGRTHQVRIHLAAIGHPLAGEAWYRRPRCRRHPRQALHAHGLEFADAAAPQRVVAPLAADLEALAVDLGLRVSDRRGGSPQAAGHPC